MSHRQLQTQRGDEAVNMLVKFLELKHGQVTSMVSIHEPHYSSGQNGVPDLVYGWNAVEVKRVEFLRLDRQPKHASIPSYTYLGNLKINKDAWMREKEWSAQNHKQLCVIAVVTFGDRNPLFIKLTHEQVDKLQESQSGKDWFCIGIWDLLHSGTVLKC